MRVFVYLHDFPAERDQHTLGICKAVHGLASGMATGGTQVTVLCEGERDVEREVMANFHVRCFKAPPRGRLDTGVPDALRRYVAQQTAGHDDVLFVLNAIFHPGTYAMSKMLRGLRVPYVVAPHDPYHPAIFARRSVLKWTYWYLRERRMLQHARAVQVLDCRHGQWLTRLGVRVPVIESINGYAATDIVPESSLKWDTNRRPSAIFMGRVDSFNKGLDILIDAMHQLNPANRPKLTIQGPDWGDRAELRSQAARLGLTDDVSFPDANFAMEASELMAQHDIFCLVSRFEGFGLAALEAMIAGRVVIVSDVAGIAPHVRASGCGVVVNPDRSSVRQGLQELLRLRPRWKEMGLAGRRYVLDVLRWDKIASDTIKEYRKLLGMTPQEPRPPVTAAVSAA